MCTLLTYKTTPQGNFPTCYSYLICVLNAKYKLPTMGSGKEEVVEGGAQPSQVEVTRGTGGKPHPHL